MRMQMGDAAPFCSGDILRRKSCDASLCGSAEAHASLRRFAQGYSFGNTANLGVTSYYQRAERATEIDHVLQVHPPQPQPHPQQSPQSQPNSPITSPPIPPQTIAQTVNDPLQNFAHSQHHIPDNRFKSLAASCLPQVPADWEHARDRQTLSRHWKRDCLRERDAEVERSVLTDRCEKPRKRRERGTLLFGENAPKTPLPVRQRIERRCVPKRLRDTMGVDALAVMIGDVLTTDRQGKKFRCKVIEDVSISDGDKGKEKKAWSGSDKCFGGANENDSIKNVTNKIFTNGNHSNGPTRGTSDQETKTDNPIHNDTNVRRIDSVVPGDPDDDGTTDELSFLVQHCDLEPERKQAHFMPYIT